MSELTMVRIYITEGERKRHRSLTEEIFDRLYKEHKVMGVTQFRGVAGFGSHGVVHSADLIHINAHLPIIIEFFDQDDVVTEALLWIRELVDPDRIVSWKVQVG